MIYFMTSMDFADSRLVGKSVWSTFQNINKIWNQTSGCDFILQKRKPPILKNGRFETNTSQTIKIGRNRSKTKLILMVLAYINVHWAQ